MATTIALAGAGMIASVHSLAAHLAPDLEVVAVSSRTEASAEALAAQAHARAVRPDDLPAGADVVVVCTPPSDHVATAIAALQAGAAVIVEKPLATTLDDADRLVDAAAATGGRVGYAENLAFAPVFTAARAHASGMGPIHHLDTHVLQERPTWGGFLHADWGGGVLFDLGAHPLALVLLLTAPARPVSVSCRLHGADDIEVDDLAELTLSFDSGLHASVTTSWRSPAPVWDLQTASADGTLRIELLPDLELEVSGEPVALPALAPGLPAPQIAQFGYLDQLESFVADFAAGREPEMNAAFGRDVLDIVCAASVSARHHGRVEAVPFTGPRDRTPQQLWRD
jgi:predicted dehydrogenase